MAASNTLQHPLAVPQISKLGVLTLYGFGIRVTMQAGHLQTECGIGPDRLKLRLPRVGHRLISSALATTDLSPCPLFDG